jgi:hypothetical protein
MQALLQSNACRLCGHNHMCAVYPGNRPTQRDMLKKVWQSLVTRIIYDSFEEMIEVEQYILNWEGKSIYRSFVLHPDYAVIV